MTTYPDLGLEPRLLAILESEIPRFSEAETTRRRQAIERLMAERDVAHLLIYGAQRVGGAVQWLTGWPITSEAAVVVTPGARDAMFVQFHNHVPQARLLARDADVAWGGPSTLASVAEELDRRGARSARIGVIGPLGFGQARTLQENGAELVDLGRDFVRLRLRKSQEEIDWIRIGAALTDAGMAALESALAPGVTEHELANAIERAYVGRGATTVIHFIGVTPMDDPSVCVPRQFHSTRRVQPGDMAMAELTAAFWDYSGQVLRTFTVAAEPTPLFRDLHAAAEAALEAITGTLRPGTAMQEIVDASGAIEDAGFTVCDDLVHGFGGGYLPPILGSRSRPAGPLPDLVLEKDMMVVVQPNVITRDGTAGVQTGELFLITDTGCERLHRFPQGLRRVAG